MYAFLYAAARTLGLTTRTLSLTNGPTNVVTIGIPALFAKADRIRDDFRMLDEWMAIHRAILALDPENYEALVALGKGHYEREEDEEAENALRAAIKLDPSRPAAHHRLAVLLQARDDDAGALRAFALVLLADPHHVDALFGTAMSLEALGSRRAKDAWRAYLRVAIDVAGQDEWVATARARLAAL